MRKLTILLTLCLLVSSLAYPQVRVGNGVKVGTGIKVLGAAAVSFPVNAELDNFNRANEGPPLSANWTNTITVGDGGMKVDTNAAIGNTTGFNSAFWNVTTFGPDCEAFVTIGSGDYGGTYVRLATPGTAGVDGYHFQYYVTGSQVQIIRIDNGVGTVILTVNGVTIDSGDKVGGTSISTTHTIWFKDGAGAWTNMGSVVDATYGAAGNIGIGQQSTVTLDDFGGGTR